MNKRIAGAALGSLLAAASVQAMAATPVADRQNYSIYVDDGGVLRRSDTKDEVSYYGTNYTVPFAHAYRALGKLGVDRKEAIRRDVYHFARLGLNAFRLHLWDVEITDSLGNLQANDHLDLLDFLIAELEGRGIDIVLTAQTNFGNGYPDKDIDTGGYSYDFDKCEIHSNPQAQKIQENYLTQLASHINPYTGLSYGRDRAIIAMEVNNEPCHTAPRQEVTAYINRMVKALRDGGFDKPVLYNVSHNPEVVQGYYDADIQGTTYQWYPTGLVSGHQRHGNFLPHVDKYPIPWADSVRNYDKMARFIYEFDPGDVLNSNLYPAIVRTLRGQGFQWVTQFAYDPTDMARFNTEYQTHFLNLAYTPAKAISMLIAYKAMQEVPRGADYGSYPDNCDFGNTQVKIFGQMSIYNSPTEFYSTAFNQQRPESVDSLEHIAGVGGNALVSYQGTGAWFLDKLDSTHWRLEVMPDVVLTRDPFANTSLDREVGQIIYAGNEMSIELPSLGENYSYKALNEGNRHNGTADGTVMNIYPGVYLLTATGSDDSVWTPTSEFANMRLGEYVAPAPSQCTVAATHSSSPDAPLETPRTSDDVPLMLPMLPEVTMDCAIASGTQHIWLETIDTDSADKDCYKLEFTPGRDEEAAIIRADHSLQLYTDISDEKPLSTRSLSLLLRQKPQGTESLSLGVEDTQGVSYMAEIKVDSLKRRSDGLYEASVSIQDLTPTATWLLPVAYPWFTARQCDITSEATDNMDEIMINAALITLNGLKKGVPVSLLLHSLQLH